MFDSFITSGSSAGTILMSTPLHVIRNMQQPHFTSYILHSVNAGIRSCTMRTDFMRPFIHWHASDLVRLKAWIWKLKQTLLRHPVCEEEQIAANNHKTTIRNDEIKALCSVFEFFSVITNIPDVNIRVQSHDLKTERTVTLNKWPVT